ncbi:MAG: hypothetical protein K2X48_07935 [Chitinophagaceae bacterium]|nr:hypothetical protein [Chitinophagaceae bacterium]
MSANTIRKKLHKYIDSADEKKLRAIFLMVEDEIDEVSDHWNDEAFVKELRRRETAYINSESGSLTLKQSAGRVKKIVENLK